MLSRALRRTKRTQRSSTRYTQNTTLTTKFGTASKLTLLTATVATVSCASLLFPKEVEADQIEKGLEEVESLIASHQDFPKPGILFRDIHPVMANSEARAAVLETLYQRYKDAGIEVVVGLESRGYYFGIPLADRLGVSFVPLRKPNKLPGELIGIDYGLEYGKDRLEFQVERIPAGTKVVVIDDLLATGGTANAAITLLKQANADIHEFHCMIELLGLKGREKIDRNIPVYTMFKYD
eukprot:TRINITY_DN281_c0_g1_i1.p1 TRINITY_DN281_c0_g1~~TRINITY_DN281_c0_g1_i1.p1  ORF type:complete len:238 (+),score=54.94 TRINITY_DN281_c0_g1_i1:43-756(+)